MTHVFIHKINPTRIKMIMALSMDSALLKLSERLNGEYNSGSLSDYKFGYYL